MKQTNADMNFDAQMERIKFVTGKRTQVELANLLSIRQSSISDAKKRGKIPPGWLITLTRIKNVHPEWILTGNGPCFIVGSPDLDGYEIEKSFMEKKADEEALRRMSSRLLADELVRRIAVSQEKMLCSDAVSKTMNNK